MELIKPQVLYSKLISALVNKLNFHDFSVTFNDVEMIVYLWTDSDRLFPIVVENREEDGFKVIYNTEEDECKKFTLDTEDMKVILNVMILFVTEIEAESIPDVGKGLNQKEAEEQTETIAISKGILKDLLRNDLIINALDNGGVDNWPWYRESIANFIKAYIQEEEFDHTSIDEDFGIDEIVEIELKKFKS